jgi:SecD/SecF fusion protein
MNTRIKWKILSILAVIGLSLWFGFPLDEKINLGLDLKGGMHLVLKVDTSGLPPQARQDAPERALEVIRNRIDQFGVREPTIHIQGKDEIVVQLPGITDRQRALDLIGKTALLEFKLVGDDANDLRQALDGDIPEGFELKYLEREPLLLEKKAALTGDALTGAYVRFDQAQFGGPVVNLEFNDEGAKKFAKVTADNVGRRLAIVLDGKVQSAPMIREEIPSGQAVITGRFSFEEANDLAIVLKVGALPAPIHIEEERTVGPLLGRDSIRDGIRAAVTGTILVFCFMLIYYLFAGLVASFALILDMLIILGALGALPVITNQRIMATLTLPGIAGIILTLGMAVDANVLIYERIREELKLGKGLRSAITSGYDKAFNAILDSNLTTLIAAFLLFQFGTGPIRGFALTLTIGILASLFTAIVATRTFFELLLSYSPKFKKLVMLKLFDRTNIDFIGKRRICYFLSLILIAIGLGAFFLKGQSSFGIDFSGGQLQEYAFDSPVEIDRLRLTLKDIGLGASTIQQFPRQPNRVLIKTPQDSADLISETLRDRFPDNEPQILRIERVGPTVGRQLRHRAILAVTWALAGILIYVAFRFKHFNFAAAGVIALLHDVLISLGLFVAAGRQIDLLTVTALLTVAGYSINDTIVIYDRVRETTHLMRKGNLKDIINSSLNQTLSRTILTTFTTLLVVVCIFLFGGEVLNDFAFILLVGFLSGIYSTIFIASPLVLAWQRGR